MLKIIVAGGRNFTDYKYIADTLDRCLPKDCEIVIGGATGVDTLALKYAFNNGLKLKVFMADWDSYGKSAGPRRNQQMAEYGDELIAFWDGSSKGTADMIKKAKANNLKTRIIKVEDEQIKVV